MLGPPPSASGWKEEASGGAGGRQVYLITLSPPPLSPSPSPSSSPPSSAGPAAPPPPSSCGSSGASPSSPLSLSPSLSSSLSSSFRRIRLSRPRRSSASVSSSSASLCAALEGEEEEDASTSAGRLATLSSNWPLASPSPQELAEAGFLMRPGLLRCFSCGLVIEAAAWEHELLRCPAWEAHTRLAARAGLNCRYVEGKPPAQSPLEYSRQRDVLALGQELRAVRAAVASEPPLSPAALGRTRKRWLAKAIANAKVLESIPALKAESDRLLDVLQKSHAQEVSESAVSTSETCFDGANDSIAEYATGSLSNVPEPGSSGNQSLAEYAGGNSDNSSESDSASEDDSVSSESTDDGEDGGKERTSTRDAEYIYREINYSELVFMQKIGAGAFGTVWKGQWRGAPVAIKVLHESDMFNRKVVREFRREAATMHMLGNHPNLVKFIGVCSMRPQAARQSLEYSSSDTGVSGTEKVGKALCIVSEFCAHGSLEGLLRGKGKIDIPFKTLVRIARDAAAGILHLHCEGVIHRDIAARNIMIGDNLSVHVGDMGFARVKDKGATYGFTMTLGPVKYMAPEAILEKKYSEKSDSFSFAVLLWEMVTREEPWNDKRSLMDVAMGVGTRGQRLPIPGSCPRPLSVLLQSCWHTNPKDRPDMLTIYKILDKYYETL